MSYERLLVICLSNQFYDSPLKTNKHLVMAELAKRGHCVLFVDPPTRLKWLPALKKHHRLPVTTRKEGIVVYTPPQPLNIPPLPYIMSLIHSSVIQRVIYLKGWNHLKKVLWVYHFDFPRVFKLATNLKPDIFIYDVVDSYADFPEYSKSDINYTGFWKKLARLDLFCKKYFEQNGKSGREWVQSREQQLSTRADIIFTSHSNLFKAFRLQNQNTHYLPNAGMFDLYSVKPKRPPKPLSKLARPIVGYSGALDAYKFDVELFSHVAASTPEINYVLIGPMQLSDSDPTINDVLQFKNVHWFGTQSFEDTAAFTNCFDAYIIPYLQNSYTINGCFPVKLFNVLATGMPVVVTDLPAYDGLREVLYVADSPNQFVSMVKKALFERDDKLRSRRIDLASRNTWEQKVDNQLALITRHLAHNSNNQ